MYKVSMRYVWVGMEEEMGNGNGRMFTFKPLIPPLISSAAFSPWAPGGLVLVVGFDMVVIRYLGTLGR